MTRSTKRNHSNVLADAGRKPHQYSDVQFAAPRLRVAAIAERGHAYMHRAEYIVTRMHRGPMAECLLITAIEDRANRLASRRVYGNGRRQTGRASQVMREQAVHVARCTTRR